MNSLSITIDECFVEIDRNGITRIVSEIIINKAGELTLYTDILFSIVRLMYHDILINLDIDVAKTVFELIGAALQQEHSDDSTWVISDNLFGEYNMRHVVSNIQASAYLIYMTLLKNENFTINQVTIEFLGSLNDRGTLIEWLRQITENLAIDDYISMTNQRFETSLKRLHEQRGAYPAINIERAIERTDDSATYKQYCKKS
tara:strand:- start:650 stop:1255 length:606 start_codon:yes stop_codon:yes gene_type:complete